MYAPAFMLGKERVLFAYKDQMFEEKVQAEMRGRELLFWFHNNNVPMEYLEAIDITDLGRKPVIVVSGFKLCFIDRPEVSRKRNERGRRKKGNI